MRFREHRGGLAESLETTVMLDDRAALLAHLARLLADYPTAAPLVSEKTVHVKHLIYDNRCDWDTYIVTVDDYGVMGFTDGPC
jgi:hypothetical protein